MTSDPIRRRYGYGAACLRLHAQPHRPEPAPSLIAAIHEAHSERWAGRSALVRGVAFGLGALLVLSLWSALTDDPDEFVDLHVVPFELEESPIQVAELPPLPKPPTPEPGNASPVT